MKGLENKTKKKYTLIIIASLFIIFCVFASSLGLTPKITNFVKMKIASAFNIQDYLEINRENTPKINVSVSSYGTTATVNITNYPSNAVSKQYRTDLSKDWKDYTEEFTISSNTIIQTRYKNSSDSDYTIGSSKIVLDMLENHGEIEIYLSQDTPIIKPGGNIKELTDDFVPIPQGFYYVGGTVDEGVVISNNADDENKGTSFEVAKELEGDQFVWVPVKSSRKIKTDIKSTNAIQSIVVTDESNGRTYNLSTNNQKTYTKDFSASNKSTYKFTVTDVQGNVETKRITLTNTNGPIHWTHGSGSSAHEVGQLWRSFNNTNGGTSGMKFGTKYTSYTQGSGIREPDKVVRKDVYDWGTVELYDGQKYWLKIALGVSTDEELAEALNINNVSDFNTNANAFSKILQNDFDEMYKSVDKYGGFYIGRYETGGFNSDKCVVRPGEKDQSINRTDWYTMYHKIKGLSNEAVFGSLIWGCQYDAMCNWIINPQRIKKSDDTRTTVETIETGIIASDVDKNIYDLAGNVVEFTMEAIGDGSRLARGGDYTSEANATGNNAYIFWVSGGFRTSSPNGGGVQYGGRATLCIK